jgi:aryl-alcohol dehydrogenase-like predicted oxidoreductase
MDQQEVRDRLDAVVRIRVTEVPPGITMTAWALAWCLQQPAVDAVVTGVKSVDQLESSAAATDLAGTWACKTSRPVVGEFARQSLSRLASTRPTATAAGH